MDHAADLALHIRLVGGDATAALETIERWLPELIKVLSARHPQLAFADEHLIETAAIDALLAYTAHPEKYDPQRSNMRNYLAMSANGDLLNALRREKTQRRNSQSLQDVENTLADGNNQYEESINNSVDASALLQTVAAEIGDPVDRQILALMLGGERATKAYAQVLGIERLPGWEQGKSVKRHKDRINKRLERLGETLNASRAAQ